MEDADLLDGIVQTCVWFVTAFIAMLLGFGLLWVYFAAMEKLG